MALGCEITTCDVLAIGRCHRCGKVFCGAHQGRIHDPGALNDGAAWAKQCVDCTANVTAARVSIRRQTVAGNG